jgi:hypothetical protein
MKYNLLKFYLFFLCLFFFVAHFNFSFNFFPDFHSYQTLIELFNEKSPFVSGWSYNIFFHIGNFFYEYIPDNDFELNLPYSIFRLSILLFFISSLLVTLYLNKSDIKKLNWVCFVALFILINFFIIDQGLIRIRSGLSASFFLYSYYLYVIKKNLPATLLMVLSFNIHQLTSITLLFFTFFMVEHNFLNFYLRKIQYSIYGILIFLLCSFIFYLHYRGFHSYSEIHWLTRYLIVITPVFIFIIFYRYNFIKLNTFDYFHPLFLIILSIVLLSFSAFNLKLIMGEGLLRIIFLSLIGVVLLVKQLNLMPFYWTYMILICFLYQLKILLYI